MAKAFINLEIEEKSYFLSGILSFLFYFFCIFLLLLYLNKEEVKKFDAASKNTVLELEIIVDNTAVKSKKIKSKQIKSEKSQTYVKKSKSISISKTANIKSLFSNVKTKAKKIEKTVVNNVKKSLVSSRFRSKFEKQRKTSDVKVSSMLEDVKVKAKSIVATDAKYQNDPYYSKIYELLAQRWRPMSVLDELYAKILIIISSSGEFDYRFVKGSGNEGFDNKLKIFLNEQKSLTYPEYTKGNKTQIEVIFKSQKG